MEQDVSKEDVEEEEAPIHIILDFLSTFFVALIVLIAGILVIGQLTGFHLFNVASGSMTPTYPVNSLVIVRDVDPKTIETGDVITFVMNEDGMLVTHRVVAVDANEKTFRTKGDANNVEDAEPVIWGNVVGKSSVRDSGDRRSICCDDGKGAQKDNDRYHNRIITAFHLVGRKQEET